MAQYVGVSFKRQGQIYFFLASPFVLSLHDKVLVKTEEGIGFGDIVAIRDDIPAGVDPDTVKPIYRPANQEDQEISIENQGLAREAKKFCQQCVARLGLDMKLVDVEVYFDKSKMIFFFTAPGRVDFRELVKDLVRNYRTRIELRQIGVRHETQMIGALGNCGQVCCCRRYLRRFEPVTIKMAKDQNLFLNPAKISGVCGRLLCCLAYEKDNYSDFQHRAPKLGRKYSTTQGVMKTLRSNMFRDSVSVLTEAGEELDFTLADWNAILLDQPRVQVQDDTTDDIPAELEALVDPELRSKGPRPERKPFKPQRREQRPRHPGERPERPRAEDGDSRRAPRPERPERQDRLDQNRPERAGSPRPQGEEVKSEADGTPRRDPRHKDKRRKPGPSRAPRPDRPQTPEHD